MLSGRRCCCSSHPGILARENVGRGGGADRIAATACCSRKLMAIVDQPHLPTRRCRVQRMRGGPPSPAVASSPLFAPSRVARRHLRIHTCALASARAGGRAGWGGRGGNLPAAASEFVGRARHPPCWRALGRDGGEAPARLARLLRRREVSLAAEGRRGGSDGRGH